MGKKVSLCTLVIFIILSLSSIATAGEKILIVTEPKWEPYFGQKMKNGGLMVDIARESFKRVGYDMSMKWMPWKRALNKTYEGEYAGIVGCYYTEERAKQLEYSNPITTAEVVFFELKGKNIKYSKLTDLMSYKIGVGRGYANTDEFDKATFLKKEEANDTTTNIKKLLKGRIDLMIDSKKVVLHLINNQFPDEKKSVSIVEPVLQSRNLHIGFSKKMPGYKKIVSDFDKGLKLIIDDGTYDKIVKSHGL